MYIGTESGPAALCGFRSLSSLMTPFKPIFILSIDGCGLGPLFGMELIFSCIFRLKFIIQNVHLLGAVAL